jgi:hypothetical protein
VFRRSGFLLDRDTADEVLMRINRSLDPIPLTDGMWASFVTARHALQDVESDGAGSTMDPERLLAAAMHLAAAHSRHFPPYVTKDLEFLLRTEALIRTWSARSGAEGSQSPGDLSQQVLSNLRSEIRNYLDVAGEAAGDELVESVLKCFARAAAIPVQGNGAGSSD